MNVGKLKLMTLVGVWCLGAGCSSTEQLRDKYISADIRKAEKLSKEVKELEKGLGIVSLF